MLFVQLFIMLAAAIGFAMAKLPTCGKCTKCQVPFDNTHNLPVDTSLSAGLLARHFTLDAQFLDVEVNQNTNTSTAILLTLNDLEKGCRTIALTNRKNATAPTADDLFLVWDNGDTKWTDRCTYDVDGVPASEVTAVFLWRYCPKGWKWPTKTKRALPVW